MLNCVQLQFLFDIYVNICFITFPKELSFTFTITATTSSIIPKLSSFHFSLSLVGGQSGNSKQDTDWIISYYCTKTPIFFNHRKIKYLVSMFTALKSYPHPYIYELISKYYMSHPFCFNLTKPLTPTSCMPIAAPTLPGIPPFPILYEAPFPQIAALLFTVLA